MLTVLQLFHVGHVVQNSRFADYVRNCTKKRAARAARLFFLIQPIKSMINDVVVAVVIS